MNFCSFATRTLNCLAIGSFTTNANGEAGAKFRFLQAGAFAGVFVLMRSIQNLQPVGAVSRGPGQGFGPMGNNPLAAGSVELEGNEHENNNENGHGEGEVEVKVAGAVASQVYMVKFCRFGMGPTACFSVGSFMTDTQCSAKAEFGFPLAGTFDGVFVLTLTVNGQEQNEFVTGFRIF